jgi:hypothetical protein
MDSQDSDGRKHNKRQWWSTALISAGPLESILWERSDGTTTDVHFDVRRRGRGSNRRKFFKPSDLKWLLRLAETLALVLIEFGDAEGPVAEELSRLSRGLRKMRRRERKKRR